MCAGDRVSLNRLERALATNIVGEVAEVFQTHAFIKYKISLDDLTRYGFVTIEEAENLQNQKINLDKFIQSRLTKENVIYFYIADFYGDLGTLKIGMKVKFDLKENSASKKFVARNVSVLDAEIPPINFKRGSIEDCNNLLGMGLDTGDHLIRSGKRGSAVSRTGGDTLRI